MLSRNEMSFNHERTMFTLPRHDTTEIARLLQLFKDIFHELTTFNAGTAAILNRGDQFFGPHTVLFFLES